MRKYKKNEMEERAETGVVLAFLLLLLLLGQYSVFIHEKTYPIHKSINDQLIIVFIY